MPTPLATTNTRSSHAARPHDVVAGVFDALRGHVRRVVPAARGVVARIESFMGAKIKRRVKPPIVLALIVAGLALAAAVVALARK